MPRIFISYRRADSLKDAGRIYDRLVEAFGKENIFKDMDSIPMGTDFRDVLSNAVAQCDVLLALMGQQWVVVKDADGQRRIDNPNDFVRIEVESALKRDSCLVIPVLVDNAPMPDAESLPPSLRELTFKNATIVRDDPDFHQDVTKIIRTLQRHFGITGPQRPAQAHSPGTGYDVHAAISDFYHAFEEQEWERASAILAEIRANDKVPRIFNMDAHEQEVRAALEAQERDRQYDILRLMPKHPNPTRIWESLQIFWQSYPDYDPDNLARFKPAVAAIQPPAHPVALPMPRWEVAQRVKALLPAPFEWITIPAGKVRLKAGDKLPQGEQMRDVHPFAIAKYPITNPQFAKFIAAGGYRQQKWWTEAGWQTKERSRWTEPRYWQDNRWNGADYPVVGVSWYEAVAFCNWLNSVIESFALPGGEEVREQVTLPSEAQWQRAAQGDDERIYPWGNKWDTLRANTKASGHERTTPVVNYPQGTSPYGVMDMAGNVWEWCRTSFESSSGELDGSDIQRVLRGGSWDFDVANYCHIDDRFGANPDDRYDDGGFRVVLTFVEVA